MSSEEPKVVVEQQPETVAVEQTLSAEGGDAAAQKPKKRKS